jgi:penicillin-binding protein 1B
MKQLSSLGFERTVTSYPSTLLGAVQMTPFEVAQIYQTFATGGFRMPLRAIREVLDVHRQPLNRYPIQVEQGADPTAVFLLNRAMQEVVISGTARGLQPNFGASGEVAGKTGTTNELRDSWFAGYTGDKLAVVWVGRDDNESTSLTGSSGAMQVWGKVMSSLPNEPLRFVEPDSIVIMPIDRVSGLPSHSYCRTAIELPFVKGYEPSGAESCEGKKVEGRMGRAFDWMKGVFQE